MRIGRIRLEGYKGIYNGLDNLNVLEINFTKSLHKLTVIVGLNGSGKSTLINSLHPLPDSNDNFMPKQRASKEVDIYNGDLLYKCRVIHDIKQNGDRETTKGEIKRINLISGEVEDLNINKNIGSYKEYLENELGLDPNFLLLSKLGGNNRGMADMKPAERKRFLNTQLSAVEVYNNMHKVLSKRASVYKSMVNNISTKLDNLGDETKLLSTLQSLENRLNTLMNDKDSIIEELASFKSVITMLDPDGSIQKNYEYIYTSIEKINKELEILNSSISSLLKRNNMSDNISSDEISSKFISLNKIINDTELEITHLETKISELLIDRESESRELIAKTNRLDSLNTNINYDNLETAIKSSKDKLKEYDDLFKQMGFENSVSLSKSEYLVGMATLSEIKETINTFRSHMDYTIINKSIDMILSDEDIDISYFDIELTKLLLERESINQEYIYASSMLELIKKLEFRPNGCKIDTCSFIEDAVNANKTNPKELVLSLGEKLVDKDLEIDFINKSKDDALEMIECMNYLKRIIRQLYNNGSIISKLPKAENFSRLAILERIRNNDNFNDIDYLQSYIEYCDSFEHYSIISNNLIKLEADYMIYQSKADLINEIILDIDTLTSKVNSISTVIDDSRQQIFSKKKELINFKALTQEYELILSVSDKIKALNNDKANLLSQFNSIKVNMTRISDAVNNINRLNSKQNNISDQIKPILDDRDEIRHAIKLLYEYNEELKTFKDKYNMAETLKYHSSPTTGIQLLYMELYMNKTLEMSNHLLSMLFDGNFTLDLPIVSEDGFSLPCRRSGFTNDDISSMSTSEVCMIGMIISFAMLKQSASKWNIPTLDEIDGGLDYENRVKIFRVLEIIMDILEVEQSIMITHNSETNYQNCDLVVLKITKEYESLISAGNVIYNYQECM